MLDAAWGRIRAVPVRRLIGLLGIVVAVFTAISPPISYAVNGYLKEHAALAFRAESIAERAALQISATSRDWQHESARLAAATGIHAKTPKPVMQRVLGPDGMPVLQHGETLPGPKTAVITPIVVNGATVGCRAIAFDSCGPASRS